MTALWWWITGLGSLGIIGLVLAFFFANAVFWMILKGLAWFYRTRIGFEKATFKAAQAQRDKDIHQDAKVFVLKQIADDYMAQQDSDYELAQFKAALNPADVCHIGADAPKLRLLTSAGRSQRADHNRVRKAAPKKVVP